MRSASTALQNYLNALRANLDAQAIFADCYTFTLQTGLILTYTNANVPITLNGYVYAANSILVDGLRFKCSTGLEVDQQQITISALTSETVGGVPFLQALRNGVFDGCEISRERAFLNSWAPADAANPIGSVILFKGRIGTIDHVGRTTAEITVNSDLVLLDLHMPRNVYSPACQHVLYDSGCGLVKSSFGTNGTVGAGSTNLVINWPGATADFDQGTLVFSSGVNNGITANIKSAIAGVSLTLSYPLLNAPAAGDSFTAYWGCDHTKATCKNKFNNLANFRGFPFIPSPTYTL
jgi:uncharacterized phage protein (TIGR02218 family)